MAECAYHMEARRLQAIHDRKQMALKRCMEQQSQNMSGEVQEKMATKSATMFSGADNFDTKREKSVNDTNAAPNNEFSTRKLANAREQKTESVKKRTQRKLNIERDQVYKILHPYEF
ncbi:uncharacterized protein [Argopecten irradians]|uniref:uncharacterized protein isoform X5 n=1 Tax=Argopecten irradians TaxID=31199 RepID=UPI003718DDCE